MSVVRNKLTYSRTDKIFDVLNYSFLGLLLLTFIYPLIFIVSASISNPDLIFVGKVWLFPKGVNFIGYEMIFKYKDIWMGYRNSLIYIVFGVPISVILTLTSAYAISHKDFMLRNLVMGLFAFTMFFGGGMIPTYLLMKDIGLIDNRLIMIIGPAAIGIWEIIITRTYFQNSLPAELRESADIDGCTEFKYFLVIAIPLSKPIIAVITLFYVVNSWNSFFMPMIYLSTRNIMPLQVILRDILGTFTMDAGLLAGIDPSQLELLRRITNSIKYGVIIVASVPVLIIYPFIQKYFVKGIMVGAIKG